MAARGATALGIDLGDKALSVARLHKLESGTTAEYRLIAVEALAAEMPGAFDVVTCMEMLEHVPDPASIVAACARLTRPGGMVFVSTINRNVKAYALAVVAAEYVLGLLPKGTHDYAKFLPPAEVASFARRAGLLPAAITGMTYNPFTKVVPARGRYRRQLHDGVPCVIDGRAGTDGSNACRHALPIDAVLFDLDGTLADTAPDLGAALNRVRRDRGLEPVALETLRSAASHGARGLLRVGMGIVPEHADYEALRDALLAHYETALCVATTLFADVDGLLDAIEARALKWGIVTNKATRYTTPLIEQLGLGRRASAVVCGDTTPFPKPHPAPLLAAARMLGVPPARCVYVGDAERDVTAGIAAGMRTIVARYGYIESHESPDTWPADGNIDRPAALLDWLPAASAT